MCGRIRSLPLHKRRHPFRFPIPPSLILAALLCVAGTAGAQQTFFIDTLAGPGWPYPDYPNSVAVASDGTIYLADRDSHTVLRVETDGSLGVLAGTGFAGYSGDGGAAAAAQLHTPTGVAVTADDATVYIADRANNRIRKVDVATRIITTAAGTGSAGFSGDGGAAAAAVLNLPIDVAVDGDGNVYIADLDNHRIRKVTVTTGVIDTIAGSGLFGFGNGGFSGDNGPATEARLNNPVGVEVDGAGNVYIGDWSNHRVRKVDVSTDPPTISTIAGTGTTGFSGDDGQATSAQLANPYGVAVADDGTVYIVDSTNQRVRKVATDGIITTVAGGPSTSFNIYLDNIQATAARLVNPRDVALDSSGNFYIAVQGQNNQGGIRKVDTSGVITTVAGGYTRGFSGDGGPAKAARLHGATGVAVDSSGNVYIADHTNNRIRKVDTSGVITTFASTGISSPRGLAVDSDDKVYVAQNHRILKIDGSTTPPTITTVAGTGSSGFSGDGGAATSAQLDEPFGVAIDSDGDIYIADAGNHRVRKVDVSADPPTISTFAGSGSHTSGGFSGDGGAATAAQLRSPYDVAIDSDGDVYIACYFNHRIRKIDVSADPPTISTFAGTGVRSFGGDGGPATSADFNNPYGVEVASDGTVYIADASNRRIRAVATDGTITTVAGTGMGITLPGVPDGSLATVATVDFPYAVAIDSDGNVYIAWSNLVSVLTTNGPPRARNASSTTPTGTPVTINLLVSDPNSDMLTVTVTTPPSNGTTTVSGLIIHYTPNMGFTGVDTFEYTVSDGQGGSTTATVRVGVGVGAPPPPPPPPPPPTTGRRRPRDDHGNTAARASRVRLNTRTGSATTSGSLQTAGDVDYFELSVPDAGILFVETTGSTDTIGTIWQDDRVLGHAIEGGNGQNFRLGVPVQSGQVVIAVQGFGRATGRYSLRTTFVVGQLENPSPNSFQSGIGTLSGWVCDADEVVLEINGTPFSAAYGTDRADTAETAAGEELCGDTDNGFGLLFNWNELGDGRHEVVATVDGVELSRTSVTVTTLGTAFLREASGMCEATDFPSTGEHVSLVWQEARQNFVITDGSAPPTGSSAVTSAVTGFLENPAPNSFQSGVGLLSGWVCEADSVTLEIDAQTYTAGYGTDRADTADACGKRDNGFGLLFNWNELGDGDYEVIARADGVAFDRATVRVTTLGTNFLRDARGTCEAVDFPEAGDTVTLTWQEAQQNFVITDVR